MAALLAGLPAKQYGIGKVLPAFHFNHAAYIKYDDDLFAPGVKCIRGFAQKLHFPLLQHVRVIQVAVFTLAEHSPYGDDRPIGSKSRLLYQFIGDYLYGTFTVDYPGVVSVYHLAAPALILHICGIEFIQPAFKLETGIGKALLKVHNIGTVNVAGAGSTCNECIGSDSQKSRDAIGTGRKSTAVFEQHNALIGGGAAYLGVCLQIGSLGELVPLEGRALDNQFQGPGDAGVNIIHSQTSVFNRLYQSIVTGIGTRLYKVVAGVDLGGSIVSSAPVGHHHSTEAPVITQNVGKQPPVLGSMYPVYIIVRAHKSPRLGLAHGNLESPQIYLPGSTFTHSRIVMQAVQFLIVQGKMLDRSTHAIRLNTLHISSGNLSAEQRIFGKILKVPAAKRVTVDVHTRGKKYVNSVLKDLVPHGFTYRAHNGGIPGRGEHGTDRETGAVISFVSAGANRIDTEACRAVGKHNRRYTQTRYRVSCTGASFNSHIITAYTVKSRRSAADKYSGLFFEGKKGNYLGDIIFP